MRVCGLLLVTGSLSVLQATTVRASDRTKHLSHQLTLVLDDSSLHTTAATAAPISGSRRSHDVHQRNLPARTDLLLDPLEALRDALHVMQTTWFELWVGTWATTIDWTGAVMNTHVVAALNSLSEALHTNPASATFDEKAAIEKDIENDIDRYFAQSIAYYFGENAFAIRNQAYDDMLWVVLGWLESTKFIDAHAQRHGGHTNGSRESWHGYQFTSAFAHRARVFYNVAARGWDTKLCGGGMVWNPTLVPYKNAITNELFIAASVGMYLYFTGDANTSPFVVGGVRYGGLEPALPHDSSYLKAAIGGYSWLKSSNMTNDDGLYVDGFHISDWRNHDSAGSGKCDARNEMVYSYNQGVLLSGLRGLWESTGDLTYLEDGHELARNAISATGWRFDGTSPDTGWAGLGRNGILEDICDSSGTCDQDGQTFKGIFFHHLTLFCEALPSEPLVPGKTHTADKYLAMLHRRSCQEYAEWVAHNAHAALETLDDNGRFGGWWGCSRPHADEIALPDGAVDYRNNRFLAPDGRYMLRESPDVAQAQDASLSFEPQTPVFDRDGMYPQRLPDLNDRGRGRTVEAQGSGVALLNALWALTQMER